jgi:hypothetical protein
MREGFDVFIISPPKLKKKLNKTSHHRPFKNFTALLTTISSYFVALPVHLSAVL